MKTLLRTFCIFLGLSSLAAIAAEPGSILVQTVAEKEETYVTPDGERATRLVPVATVVPGDTVIYTVTFTNVSDADAENIVVTDPVPGEMVYVHGSAFGPGTNISFSADNGERFAALDDLTVVDEAGNERPVRPTDITHIRWVLRTPLPAGEKGYARFSAVLR